MAQKDPIAFRRRLAAGEKLSGTFIKTPTGHAIEIFGDLAYDFVVIDEEHAPFDRQAIDQALVAAHAARIAALVRVASASPSNLLSVLDCGAAGGRSLGLIPDIETLQPMLGTTLGVGGYWNLPLTCQWLALSRAQVGQDKPLIATNGAQNGLDMVRMMLAGASAVQMASAVMLRGVNVLSTALAEFEAYLARKQLTAPQLIGLAADRRQSFSAMPLRRDNWRNYVIS